MDGCNKFDAGRGFCRAHGGGKRCQETHCVKADVGGGYCTAHGGGKRCRVTGCVKIAQGGGKCRAHGGVRRCRHSDCVNLARGHNGMCSEHGGARLCATQGCRRLAKGGTKPIFCLNCVVKLDSEKLFDLNWLADAMASDDESQKRSAPSRVSGVRSKETLQKTSPPSESIESPSCSALTILSEIVDKNDLTPCLENDQPIEGDEKTPGKETGSSYEDGTENLDIFQVGSCLLNGCARSFGGNCSCLSNCECCRPRNGDKDFSNGGSQRKCCSDTMTRSSVTQARAIDNNGGGDNIVDSNKIGENDRTSMRKTKVRLELPKDLIVTKVVALLKTISNVCSVHVLQEVEWNENGNDVATVMLLGPKYPDVTELELLGAMVGTSDMFVILEQSEMQWSHQEIILYIPEMMCQSACGNTIINAINSSDLRENLSAMHFEFDQRLLICRGRNLRASQLCDVIRSIGFESQIKQVAPIPKEYMFQTRAVLDQATSCRLRGVLCDVEGVEQISVLYSSRRVFASGYIETPQKIIDHAAHYGLILSLLGAESVHVDITRDMSHPNSAINPTVDHECDNQTCSRIGCEQYIATLAHTAALAAGWIVPGCAMAWGGECTCGENCKCKGCPKHDPDRYAGLFI
uniref:Uncharacterized protein AlNc14C108G6289 n=1 Tax=Albugo laibachii Nc14 TaxID=890382 RepID=F0WI82_9STRA|nr:conserved hypothetical protein [Albugo laibachii Nc14]|eukprot:CCA20961.1 conserved hypothetical protein [Albugo laibachii Nc14]